jgi:2-dehydropantoate 2-reductase
MRVLVVGCGAMGATYAVALARAGHVVEVLEASAALAEALRAGAVTVVQPDGAEHRLEVRAATDAAGLTAAPDVAMVFVKATHSAAAARSLAPLVGAATIVATVQNGWGHGEVLAGHVAPERLVVGVTYESANAPAPDRVRHYATGPTHLGPWQAGASPAAAEEVAELLRTAGLQATASADARPEIWNKLIFNAAYSSVPSTTGLSLPGVRALDGAWVLCGALVEEACAIARLEGVDVDPSVVVAKAADLAERAGATPGGGKPSMLLDIEHRRRTEVDAINGAVVAVADRHGAPAPLNRAMHALITGIERSWADA